MPLRGKDDERMVDVMAERPGIMLYFDMAEPLKGLGYEEKGRLLEAILDYGQFGVAPEFDGLLTVVWGFIRPKLDADAKSYRKKVVKNTYSSYCSKEKKADRTPMELDEWLEYNGIDAEWNKSVPVDAERYPTINSTKNPTANLTAKTITVADGGGKGEEDEETMRRQKIAMLANYHPERWEV
jgi:hypothetical protein